MATPQQSMLDPSEPRRPLAIVVTAQSGRFLPHLEDEARKVRANLDKSGAFDVLLLSNPSWEELRRELEDPKNVGRIAIIHFAGHADGQGIMLAKGIGAHSGEDIRKLAVFLRTSGVSFIFLNACLTDSFADILLKELGEHITIVFTRDRVTDASASSLAEQFYQRATTESGIGLKNAFDMSTEELKSRHPNIESQWGLITRAPECSLSDLAQLKTPLEEDVDTTRNYRFLIWYCLAMWLIGTVSLACAYYFCTSPAFKHSFLYSVGPDADNIALPLDRQHVGFAIEWVRQGVLLVFIIITLVFWNPPRREAWRPKGSSRFRSKLFWMLVVGEIAIAAFIVRYHLIVAPVELSKSHLWIKILDDGELLAARWKETWPETAIWEDAGRLQQDSERWHLMFVRPYLFYMPYSFVNYGLIMIPMFYCVLENTLYRHQLVKRRHGPRVVAAVRTGQSMQELERVVRSAFRRCVHSVRASLVFMLGLAVIMIYEIMIGYLTQAPMAFFITFMTFATIAFIGIVITAAMICLYQSKLTQAENIINSEHEKGRRTREFVSDAEAMLDRYQPIRVVINKHNVALIILGMSAIMIIMFFINRRVGIF